MVNCLNLKKYKKENKTNTDINTVTRRNSPASLSFQTLIADVLLKSIELAGDGLYSLPEGEIIPLSGVSKSGAGAIIQAGGAGRCVLSTGCVEAQPLIASSNITFKLINLTLSICQFSRIFLIECRDVALARLHVFNGVFSQI